MPVSQTQVSSHALSSKDLKTFLKLDNIESQSEPVALEKLASLVAMEVEAARHCAASFIEFNMAEKGYGSLFFPNVARLQSGAAQAERTWPFQAGMTISLWFNVVQYGMDGHQLRLLTFFLPTDPETVLFKLFIDPQDFNLIIGTSVATNRVSDHSFRPGRWAHVAVACGKTTRSKGMTMSVWIDGVQMKEVKTAAFSSGTSAGSFSVRRFCLPILYIIYNI